MSKWRSTDDTHATLRSTLVHEVIHDEFKEELHTMMTERTKGETPNNMSGVQEGVKACSLQMVRHKGDKTQK